MNILKILNYNGKKEVSTDVKEILEKFLRKTNPELFKEMKVKGEFLVNLQGNLHRKIRDSYSDKSIDSKYYFNLESKSKARAYSIPDKRSLTIVDNLEGVCIFGLNSKIVDDVKEGLENLTGVNLTLESMNWNINEKIKKNFLENLKTYFSKLKKQ